MFDEHLGSSGGKNEVHFSWCGVVLAHVRVTNGGAARRDGARELTSGRYNQQRKCTSVDERVRNNSW